MISDRPSLKPFSATLSRAEFTRLTPLVSPSPSADWHLPSGLRPASRLIVLACQSSLLGLLCPSLAHLVLTYGCLTRLAPSLKRELLRQL